MNETSFHLENVQYSLIWMFLLICYIKKGIFFLYCIVLNTNLRINAFNLSFNQMLAKFNTIIRTRGLVMYIYICIYINYFKNGFSTVLSDKLKKIVSDVENTMLKFSIIPTFQ